MIIGSLSVISFGYYYYFSNNTNIYLDKDIQQVTDSLNKDIQTISNNLNTGTQTISNNLEANIQTESTKLIDTALLTDDTMWYDYLNEILMKNMTNESTSFGLSPSEYKKYIRENP